METENDKALKARPKLSKNVLNVIRTTMRNNIQLTHIADNKANVLLSLNAIMLTFLLPVIIANFDLIIEKQLGLALIFFVLTCLITIYLSAIALRPGNFKKLEKERGASEFSSPFFFVNYQKMTAVDIESHIDAAIENDDTVRKHIVQDMYFIGSRLGQKMNIVRSAFNIFFTGLILSVLIASFIMLVIN